MRRTALAAVLAALATASAQDLPQAVRTSGQAIASLDAGTANVDWEDAGVAQLKLLPRLSALRRLQINPSGDDTAAWQAIGVDDLAPLAELPALEVLSLPYCCHLSPLHLRRLAACRHLADVMLINEAIVLDEAAAKEIAAWPALRSLDLSLIRVTAAGLAALAAAPHLEELELSRCRDLGAKEFAAVTGLRGLQRLTLAGTGQPDLIAALRGDSPPDAWALDLAAIRGLAALPKLSHLALIECTLPVPHMLAELPANLGSLELCSTDADPEVLRDLRRLGRLRHLSLTDSHAADKAAFRVAAADVLGTLRLDSFAWHGDLDGAMREALRGQPDLTALTIRCDDDLAFAAAMPKLKRLELGERMAVVAGNPTTVIPSSEAVAVLRGSASLASVVYQGRLRADVGAALQAALGAKIEFRYFH